MASLADYMNITFKYKALEEERKSERADVVESMMKLQYAAEEKEKDRIHDVTTASILDKRKTKNILLEATLDAMDDARDKGLTIETGLNKILTGSPEKSTSGGVKIGQNYLDTEKQKVGLLLTNYNMINNEVNLANEGARAAIDIDINSDGLLSAQELETYKTANPDILEAFGVPDLPRSYVEGAQNWLTSEEGRKIQEKKREAIAALNIMKGWDDTGISEEQLGERNMARTAEVLGQQEEMIKHIIKAEDIKAPKTGTAGALTAEQDESDIRFRSTVKEVKSDIDQTSKNFQKDLPWAMSSDILKKSLAANPGLYRKNAEETLAAWFSGRDIEGKSIEGKTSRTIRNMYKKFYNKKENTGSSSEKRAYAIENMVTSSEFNEILKDDGKVKKAFNWPGSKAHEAAASRVFHGVIDLYRQTVDASLAKGATGIGMDFIKELGVSKISGTGVRRKEMLDKMATEFSDDYMKIMRDAYKGITPRETSKNPKNPLYAIDGVYQYPELFENEEYINYHSKKKGGDWLSKEPTDEDWFSKEPGN